MQSARDIVRDAGAPAVAVLQAARRLLGDALLAWEPESMWLELERQEADPPPEARARLSAAVALHLCPSFYWDFLVTTKTALALDGYQVLPETLEEPTPAQLAWAFEEAAWVRRLLGDDKLVPEHEARAGVAVILDRAGLIVAPEQLSFAEELLERRLPAADVAAEVRRRWPDVRSRLLGAEIPETPAGVQLARLAAVELHVRERRGAAETALAALR